MTEANVKVITEFNVKNMSKFGASDCALNDPLSLLSGSQRAGVNPDDGVLKTAVQTIHS